MHGHSSVPLFLLFGALAITLPAHADTSFSHPLPGVSVDATPGLLVTVYHRGNDRSEGSPPGFVDIADAVSYARAHSPDYGFIDTHVNAGQGSLSLSLNGGDNTATNAFLGGEAAGAATSDGTNLNSTLLDFRGYIYLPAAGTYTWTLANADDAAAVYIGGNGTPGSGTLLLSKNYSNGISSAPGLPNPLHTDVFPIAGVDQVGWYPIEIFYYNQTIGGGGGANLNLTINGPGAVQFAAYDVFAPNPLHRYQFLNTDGSGTVFDTAVADQSNGKLVGGAAINGNSLVTTGAVGQAAQLPDGGIDYFTGSFSIEQWFTPANQQANNQTLFAFGSDANNYLIGHLNGSIGESNALNVAVKTGGPTTYLYLSVLAPANKQSMLAFTYDGTTRIATLYLNGHLYNTYALSSPINLAAIAGAYNGINGLSVLGEPSLNGRTQQFRLVREALTAEQVLQDYLRP